MTGLEKHVPVELLQGGEGAALRLPDVNMTPSIRVNPSDMQLGRVNCESKYLPNRKVNVSFLY